MTKVMQQRIALVTGGKRGIGYEGCRMLAAQGHQVLLGSRDPDAASVSALQALVEAEYNGLDVLVNNAGVYLATTLNPENPKMSLKETLIQFVGKMYFDRGGQKRTYAALSEALTKSGGIITTRLPNVPPTPTHMERLRHIIGIERWGQRRLQVFLGEPFMLDGHKPYKPAEDLSWQALLDAFKETRAETLALAERLSGADPASTVEHNQFGPFHAKGWLRYLNTHAWTEAKAIK